MTDPTHQFPHENGGRPKDRPKRMSLWLRLLLCLSLSGNLLFAGLVAGAMLRAQTDPKGPRNRPPPPQAAMMIGGMVFRDLDRSERRALRRMAEGEVGSVFKKRRQEVERLLAIIGADSFDLDVLRSELAAQNLSREALETRMVDTWIAHLQGMSPEERKAFVARMIERLDRRKRQNSKEDRNRLPVVDRVDH
ncbi:putative integral membrane protein [Tritonibacter multivorans]|uniref:Putative integral membrane protein n=1 Tax=Tritonibacter multivorans TaxID=928856 RepID=A0A0P1G118_9RHOB|nr:periplasmic heavy metal sensor [Tritonibacter multivorans]MDA7419349.1 periplasmic heavy metal sensor [Tritonibacter multivorans]CUH75285.1 putative integral membrane protein [Tritonibacter multivorans]SFD21678.1 protein refolding chaperone Spy/CpxP family [Tritonibacter multivorans]